MSSPKLSQTFRTANGQLLTAARVMVGRDTRPPAEIEFRFPGMFILKANTNYELTICDATPARKDGKPDRRFTPRMQVRVLEFICESQEEKIK